MFEGRQTGIATYMKDRQDALLNNIMRRWAGMHDVTKPEHVYSVSVSGLEINAA